MRCLAATLLLLGLISLGCNRPNNPAPATNSPTDTGVNKRDQNDPPGREPVTGQDENSADVQTTADIRKRIVAEQNFSVNARNVKILTSKGKVILRGPVANQAEKDRIDTIAKEVAGAGNVTNEIDVENAAITPERPADNPPPNDPNPKPVRPEDSPKVLPPVTPPVAPTDPPAPAPAPGTEPPVKPAPKS